MLLHVLSIQMLNVSFATFVTVLWYQQYHVLQYIHSYLYPTLNILLHGVSECIVNVLQTSQYSFSFILLKFFVFYNIISFHVTSQYSARYNTIHSVYYSSSFPILYIFATLQH